MNDLYWKHFFIIYFKIYFAWLKLIKIKHRKKNMEKIVTIIITGSNKGSK